MAEEIMEFNSTMNEEIGARVARIRVEKEMMSKEVAMRKDGDRHYKICINK